MWATLKAGEPWHALVKNPCKNGDHHRVRANATPMVCAGKTVGYTWVRTKPARDEVAPAEALYVRFRAGNAGNFRFNNGLISRSGALAWTSLRQTMPGRRRILLTTTTAAAGVA